MEIHADARIPFPRDRVFSAYRDDIVALVPYLQNVRGIEMKSRREEGTRIELVNEWRGGGDIPGPLRAVLGESALGWTDYASWDSVAKVCDWRTEPHAFKEAVTSRGQNVFLEEDGGAATLVQVRGRLDVDAKKIRGVPGFLAGSVGRGLEEFLVGKIQSSLLETSRGLTRFLEERARSGGG